MRPPKDPPPPQIYTYLSLLTVLIWLSWFVVKGSPDLMDAMVCSMADLCEVYK